MFIFYFLYIKTLKCSILNKPWSNFFLIIYLFLNLGLIFKYW